VASVRRLRDYFSRGKNGESSRFVRLGPVLTHPPPACLPKACVIRLRSTFRVASLGHGEAVQTFSNPEVTAFLREIAGSLPPGVLPQRGSAKLQQSFDNLQISIGSR